MAEDQTRKQYNEGMWKASRKAFDRHYIRTRGDGRWMLQRPNERPEDSDAAGNKGWTWIMGAEIACMGHMCISVVGDIDTVVFGHGPPNHFARILWMGRSDSLGYIQEKVHIGMSSHLLSEVYEPEVARTELESRVRDRLEELRYDERPHVTDDPETEDEASEAQLALDDQASAIVNEGYGCEHADVEIRTYAEAYEHYTEDGSQRLFQFLYDSDAEIESETIHSIGMVIAPRVFYAHAAVARLAELLTAELPREND